MAKLPVPQASSPAFFPRVITRLKDGNFLAIYGILRKDRRPAEPPPFDPPGPHAEKRDAVGPKPQ